jgi:hypothetical protein
MAPVSKVVALNFSASCALAPRGGRGGLTSLEARVVVLVGDFGAGLQVGVTLQWGGFSSWQGKESPTDFLGYFTGKAETGSVRVTYVIFLFCKEGDRHSL